MTSHIMPWGTLKSFKEQKPYTQTAFSLRARMYETEWHSNGVMTSHIMFHYEANLQKRIHVQCICSHKSLAHQNACISAKQLNSKKPQVFLW